MGGCDLNCFPNLLCQRSNTLLVANKIKITNEIRGIT